MHALILLALVLVFAVFGCGGTEPKPVDPLSIEALCAPGADVARIAGRAAVLAACDDEPCRERAQAIFDLTDETANAFCPHVPKPVEVWPALPDSGAGGGPTARVGSCEDCRRASVP